LSDNDTQTDNVDYSVPETIVLVKVNATTIDVFVNDPEGMQFYTGLDNVDMFTGVIAFLGLAAQTKISVCNTNFGCQKPVASHVNQTKAIYS
jgi:hypothetical protein